MKFIKKNIEIVVLSLLALSFIIGYLFMGGDNLVILQKTAMFTYLLFAIYFTITKKDKTGLVFAILFTVFSDSFLITHTSITELIRVVAMITFSIAQIFHMLYLNSEANNKQKLIFNILRASIFVVVLIVLIIMQNTLPIVIVTAFYFVMLVMNLIQSFINCKQHLLMTIGYCFFIVCDVFVGLSTGMELGILPSLSESAMDIFIAIRSCDWVCYLIAQYLFVLYIYTNKAKGYKLLNI